MATHSNEPVEPLLTTEEAAVILNIKRETLVNWRCTGRYNLPHIKVGRCVRYRRDAILDFIDRMQKGSSNLDNEEAV